MAAYDTFQIVEALDSVSKKLEVVYDKTIKPDFLLWMQHWGMTKAAPNSQYVWELTDGGSRVLESQRVKQFRRKHLYKFLEDLKKKTDDKYCLVLPRENKDGSLTFDWSRIRYDRTAYDRKILDGIARDAHMKIETEGQPSEMIREYILKNEKARIDLTSRKCEGIHNRRTVTFCDPLWVTIYPDKPIYPAEKVIRLLTERFEAKR
jgi:hypothetical protein